MGRRRRQLPRTPHGTHRAAVGLPRGPSSGSGLAANRPRAPAGDGENRPPGAPGCPHDPPRVILFEDERYLAVEKPSGVSMATPRGAEAGPIVSQFLKECGERAWSESEAPFLIHRLDVGTSGIVLLARSREAHRRASLLFQSRKVEKAYRAIAWGHPVPARGTLDAPLAMDRGDRRKMRVAPAGKAAATDYRTLARLAAV